MTSSQLRDEFQKLCKASRDIMMKLDARATRPPSPATGGGVPAQGHGCAATDTSSSPRDQHARAARATRPHSWATVGGGSASRTCVCRRRDRRETSTPVPLARCDHPTASSLRRQGLRGAAHECPQRRVALTVRPAVYHSNI